MSIMYAQMGMSAIGSVSGFLQSSHEAKMQKMTQAYQNRMSDISKAVTLTALNENEIGARDITVRTRQAMQVQSLKDKSAAITDAAAAGVRGSSVTAAVRGLERSRLQAHNALKKRFEAQQQMDLNKRRGVHMAAALNRDVSPIGKPSAASALLGLGASLLDIYDSNQPEGQQSTDFMSRWGE